MKISSNFSREEFACKCGNCDFDTVDIELIQVAEIIRSHIGAFSPASACRCVEHNEKIQKEANPRYKPYSSRSQHLYGRAMDIHYHDPVDLYHFLDDLYPNKFGLGLYSWGVHIDTRSDIPARWSR